MILNGNTAGQVDYLYISSDNQDNHMIMTLLFITQCKPVKKKPCRTILMWHRNFPYTISVQILRDNLKER